MTDRVVDEPLDADALVRGTADEASGALVVVRDAAPPSGTRAAADRAPADAPGEAIAPGGRSSGEARSSAAGAPDVSGADRALADLEDEALRRFDVRRCRLRLRREAPPGAVALEAVVRAPHRADAFDAARWAVSAARERALPLLSGSRKARDEP